MNIEERLAEIKKALIESPVNRDSIGLVMYWLKERLENGYSYAGMTWTPTKRHGSITGWTIETGVYKIDEEGNIEQLSRKL